MVARFRSSNVLSLGTVQRSFAEVTGLDPHENREMVAVFFNLFPSKGERVPAYYTQPVYRRLADLDEPLRTDYHTALPALLAWADV